MTQTPLKWLRFMMFLGLCLMLPSEIGQSEPLRSPDQLLAQIFEPPPGQGSPGQTAGGGRRDGGQCEATQVRSRVNTPRRLEQSLVALMPPNNAGLTTTTQPTFLFYVPATSAQTAEFVLDDGRAATGKPTEIVRIQVQLPKTPGIVILKLPEKTPTLAANQDYFWAFALICGRGSIQDPLVSGRIRRIQLEPELANRLQSSPPLEQVRLYAASGIWHEAVAGLAVLRQTKPDDPEFVKAWQTLLQSVGLSDIATAPLYLTLPTQKAATQLEAQVIR